MEKKEINKEIDEAKATVEKEAKKMAKKLEKAEKEALDALDAVKKMSPEERAAKTKEIVDSAVEKMNKAGEDVKKTVLGEDGKFDNEDIKRLANGVLDVGAGAMGTLEKGFGWLRKKIEKAKIK